jgi:protein-S-isoprenylcysteine O-methyltransferase Ste14
MSDQAAASWTERATAMLARRRVASGFVFGVVVLWLAHPSRRTILIGSAVACLGEGIRIWAAGHLNKSRDVTSSGPYRWSAHPLYVGSSIMGAGLAMASGSVAAALLIAAYLGLTLTAAARREEAFLRRTFGDRYERFRRGEIAPSDATRRFSVAQAIANHEHRALIGLLIAVLLLALKAMSGV